MHLSPQPIGCLGGLVDDAVDQAIACEEFLLEIPNIQDRLKPIPHREDDPQTDPSGRRLAGCYPMQRVTWLIFAEKHGLGMNCCERTLTFLAWHYIKLGPEAFKRYLPVDVILKNQKRHIFPLDIQNKIWFPLSQGEEILIAENAPLGVFDPGHDFVLRLQDEVTRRRLLAEGYKTADMMDEKDNLISIPLTANAPFDSSQIDVGAVQASTALGASMGAEYSDNKGQGAAIGAAAGGLSTAIGQLMAGGGVGRSPGDITDKIKAQKSLLGGYKLPSVEIEHSLSDSDKLTIGLGFGLLAGAIYLGLKSSNKK